MNASVRERPGARRCPCCHDGVARTALAAACLECASVHHRECFEELLVLCGVAGGSMVVALASGFVPLLVPEVLLVLVLPLLCATTRLAAFAASLTGAGP